MDVTLEAGSGPHCLLSAMSELLYAAASDRWHSIRRGRRTVRRADQVIMRLPACRARSARGYYYTGAASQRGAAILFLKSGLIDDA